MSLPRRINSVPGHGAAGEWSHRVTSHAAHEAPLACDVTAAEDTLADRFAEYRRLFDHALVHRRSSESTTTFRLADRPGVRDWVLDLVRREAACCPFQSYEVTVDGDHIV